MKPCARTGRDDGFSIVEAMVALGLMLTVSAAAFVMLTSSESLLHTQPEAADVQQRLRVAVGALFRDLAAAEGVFPYRLAGGNPDPPGTFRTDAITLVHRTVPVGPTALRTYFHKEEDGPRTYQLVQADGAGNDEPVADHVVELGFSYAGTPPGEPCVAPAGAGPLADLPGEGFSDGPWCTSADGAVLFDADLLRIRRVHVRLRVQAAIDAFRGPVGRLFRKGGSASLGSRYVPDAVAAFYVAPRPLNLGP